MCCAVQELMRKTVNVVVHSAASVSFSEALGEALAKNVAGKPNATSSWVVARVLVPAHCDIERDACSLVGGGTAGALDIFELGKSFEKLEVYVHVSTAYVSCNRLGTILEQAPQLNFPPGISNAEELYRMLLSHDDATLDRMTPSLIGNFPNTYCYSKAISETLINQVSFV